MESKHCLERLQSAFIKWQHATKVAQEHWEIIRQNALTYCALENVNEIALERQRLVNEKGIILIRGRDEQQQDSACKNSERRLRAEKTPKRAGEANKAIVTEAND